VETDQPDPEREITLETKEKQAKQVSVTLKNPMRKLITFEVIFEGDGLIGQRIFDINPLQE